mmetsp:Transcript_23640/g.23357  ORF Transcript_23640/g.23357 Transcript_23640/m.23357 type:complete len:107 (+) Transcript_23640:711-1031(+)
MQRKAEGTALLEIEHYKMDNERLIQMLSQTQEFSKVGQLAKDCGSNVRFMNPDRQPTGCHYPKKQSQLKDYKPSDEMEDWIPEEAFKLAHDFRNKCASSVSQSLMN